MNTVAFLIGNGESRKEIDLEVLRNKGTIVGCNALFRDFTPDVLMAIDQKMVNEIIDSKYALENYLVIPSNRHARVSRARSNSHCYPLPIEKFNTCGAAIMQYAGKINADITYLLGFDCYGGNVYEGTTNYANRVKPNRYRVFVKLFEHAFTIFPSTKYINVIKDKKDGITPLLTKKLNNYDTVDMDLFLENLPKFPYQEPIYYHDTFKKHD
jgi:hypothetical protein